MVIQDSGRRIDGLTCLLSRLPPELRLYIYRLSTPCIRHRKRRILSDYIGDGKWMATSPNIFDDAAPILLCDPYLFVYSKLERHESLVKHFSLLIARVFSEDAHWVIRLARPMVTRLAVTINFNRFYNSKSIDLQASFTSYFAGLATFNGLKSLVISFGPEILPSAEETYNLYKDAFSPQRIASTYEASPPIGHFKRALRALKAEIPDGCGVRFRFDRAGMPDVPKYITGRRKLIEHLEDVNRCMQDLWRSVASESDVDLK